MSDPVQNQDDQQDKLTSGISSEEGTQVKQAIGRCNVVPELCPEHLYGHIDYYKDDENQNLCCSGFKSRYYDFLDRHQGCDHTVPDYYEGYGNHYVRAFQDELIPDVYERIKVPNTHPWKGDPNKPDNVNIFTDKRLPSPLEKPCPSCTGADSEEEPDWGEVMRDSAFHTVDPRGLTIDGINWHLRARKLLQVYIDQGLETNMEHKEIEIRCEVAKNKFKKTIKVGEINILELDNELFREFAFTTHTPAYLDAGYRNLYSADEARMSTVLRTEEWLNRDTWDQVIDMKCHQADWTEALCESLTSDDNSGTDPIDELKKVLDEIRKDFDIKY